MRLCSDGVSLLHSHWAENVQRTRPAAFASLSDGWQQMQKGTIWSFLSSEAGCPRDASQGGCVATSYTYSFARSGLEVAILLCQPTLRKPIFCTQSPIQSEL